MKNKYCVFILSHGRAGNVVTARTLRRRNYTGEIYILIDDTDKQKYEYQKEFGDKVIIFDKKKAAEKTDTLDNFGNLKAVVYARNTVNEIANKLGYQYYIVMDDDYHVFQYRFDSENRYRYKLIYNLNVVFDICITFLKYTNIDCLCMAQGGDFIGGAESGISKSVKLTRKMMNVYFCNTEKPIEFYGSINEDVNAYVHNGSVGKVYFTTNMLSIVQGVTQGNAGGLTDIYLELGTYVKSFYSVIIQPSCVKVAVMGTKFKRIHHSVSWDHAVPVIISEKYRKR